MMIESRCGIKCGECEYKEKMNCAGCVNIEKPFWGESCPVKTCCESKAIVNCGLCDTFPCELLTQFAFDKEQGDEGARIKQCEYWCKKEKYQWKKSEKEIYLPKSVPTIVQVPKQKFFMIKGKGNPNLEDFSERIGVLYSISYAVRMMPKNGFTPEGYFEYTVYPLEGIWDLTEQGKVEESLNKDELLYTIMIRQPDFVNEVVVEKALEIVKKKKPNPLLSEITFGEMEDGLCVQMLHNGSYDLEKESFMRMQEFVAEHGFIRKSMIHREIYIKSVKNNESEIGNIPNSKMEQEKPKTVLRYFIKKE